MSDASAEENDLHYGIIVDAGSSGSRAHVYSWRSSSSSSPSSTASIDLVKDDLLKIKPGLSSFAGNVSGVRDSVRQLVAHARRSVPEARTAVDAIYLMATAGLRMKGEEAATEILQAAAAELAASPLLFKPEWAYILSGEEEAIYGWLTVNYLLGKNGLLQQSSASAAVGAAAADGLGAASVQLVYSVEARDKAAAAAAAQGAEHPTTAQVQLAGRSFHLSGESFAGFGLFQARERVLSSLLGSAPAEYHSLLPHPCYPRGFTGVIQEEPPRKFVGTGLHNECRALYMQLFHEYRGRCKERLQTTEEPSFAGAGFPALPPKIFGFSFMYDRTGAIGLLDSSVELFGMQTMTVADIQGAAAHACGLAPQDAQARFAAAMDSERWAEFCGDATYLAVLLEQGFGIKPDLELTMGNKIGNFEIVWGVGAIVAKVSELQQSKRQA
eukprot:CAMPEP_0178454962 /NCGR_PEP_ID=MMETSP0689_2-20121128/45651_1 /TAXON_ID=160604 /ORGANISM="Amphidinium massartii, Strain CS-259" /LENGTH=440 /DNA_ID=CAMNT_0020080957 /DNA_START=267 /DNA_END=1587 /DNA_ORIENTATION=+